MLASVCLPRFIQLPWTFPASVLWLDSKQCTHTAVACSARHMQSGLMLLLSLSRRYQVVRSSGLHRNIEFGAPTSQSSTATTSCLPSFMSTILRDNKPKTQLKSVLASKNVFQK